VIWITKCRFLFGPATARVKAHRARKSRGVHLALIEVPEALVDRLADEGYLDGDNTVAQAIESFLAHHTSFSNKARG
jgi:hypothetical protein